MDKPEAAQGAVRYRRKRRVLRICENTLVRFPLPDFPVDPGISMIVSEKTEQGPSRSAGTKNKR